MKRIPSGLLFAALFLLAPTAPRLFAEESASQLADQNLGSDSDSPDQSAEDLAKRNGVAVKPGQDAEESAADLASKMGEDAAPAADESAEDLAKQNGVAVEAGVDGDESAAKLAEKNGLEKKSKKVSDPAASVFAGGEGVNGSVYAVVALADGSSVIGGRFTTVNGQPRSNLARVKADGSLDAGMLGAPTDGVEGAVYALAIDANGNLLVGGFFTAAQGQQVQNFARYLASGKLDPAFNGGQTPNGPVYSIAVQPNGKIIIGGTFSMVGTSPRRNLARFKTDSTLDGGLAANIDGGTGAVRSLATLANGSVTAGGTFSVPGQSSRNILSVGAE